MESSRNRARYEHCLARAHKALHDAEWALDLINDPGALDDCVAIKGEVARLLEDSVSGRRRPLRQQQLEVNQ